MKYFLPILFMASCLFLSSCASTYRSVDPHKMPFSFTENTGDIQYSYTYDALKIMNNKKYVKKEFKRGMRVVAVRITNNSDKALRLNENLKLLVGNNQTVPVDPTIVAQNIKQGTWIYLLYLPLTITFTTTNTTYNNNYGITDDTKITRLPIGPFMSLGNILVASSSNKSFRKDLQKFNLMEKTIQPGETFYGLMTLNGLASDPIKFEVK